MNQQRRNTIIQLGRTLQDALTTDTVQAGHGGEHDHRVLQLSSLYHATCHPACICRNGNGTNGNGKHHGCTSPYAALEHALKEMRRLGKQQAIAGHPLQVLRWHYVNRYIEATRKPHPVHPKNHHLIHVDGQWQPAKSQRREPVGTVITIGTGQDRTRCLVVETWHPDVRQDRVDLALGWLDRELPRKLHLPHELDQAA